MISRTNPTRRRRAAALACCCPWLLFAAACSGGDDGAVSDSAAANEPSELGTGQTLEAYAASVRVTFEDSTEGYLLEGDMMTDYEGLVRYFESRANAVQDKATGQLVTVGGQQVWDVRHDAQNLRYCLTGGWSTPSEASVEATLVTAAADWSRIANVGFIHEASLDGNTNCIEAAVTAGSVDFRVTRNLDGTGAWLSGSWAALPGFTAANQQLAQGTSLTLGIMRHELGHILGLNHEQFHPDESTLNCTVDDYSSFYPVAGNVVGVGELTEYDTNSIMHYTSGGNPSCAGGTVNTATMTDADGRGARILYGAPAAWISFHRAPMYL